MNLSTGLKNTLKNIKFDNDSNQMIVNLLREVDNKEFLYVGLSEKDDYVTFIPNKKEHVDALRYTITNQNIKIDHPAFASVLKKMEDTSRLKDLSVDDSAYKILKRYSIEEQYYSSYYVLHCLNTATGDEVLNLQNLNGNNLDIQNLSEFKVSEIKVGRFINKFLKEQEEKFTDQEIEKFVNSFKSDNVYSRNLEKNIEVVEGRDIKTWYYSANYSKTDTSILKNSCMRTQKAQTFLKMFINRENGLKMLILKDDSGKLIGRALLWQTSHGKYMDRVYGQDHIIQVFSKWGEDNGYNYSYNKENSPYEMTVDVKVDLSHRFPYLDTFKIMTVEDSKKTGLQNAKLSKFAESGKESYRLGSTEGLLL